MPPDPSHQSEDRRVSNDVPYATGHAIDSHNEHDDISYQEYEILPQEYNDGYAGPEDLDVQDSNSEDDNSDEEPDEGKNESTCAFDQSVKIELSELWNSSNNRITDIVMDSTKEQEIKNAMANFQLPLSSIPSWAKDIPEEEWKQKILNKIKSSSE